MSAWLPAVSPRCCHSPISKWASRRDVQGQAPCSSTASSTSCCSSSSSSSHLAPTRASSAKRPEPVPCRTCPQAARFCRFGCCLMRNCLLCSWSPFLMSFQSSSLLIMHWLCSKIAEAAMASTAQVVKRVFLMVHCRRRIKLQSVHDSLDENACPGHASSLVRLDRQDRGMIVSVTSCSSWLWKPDRRVLCRRTSYKWLLT